jgi:PhzF family phenazine biosynthesis protein
MREPIFIVDAFTPRPFAGNPAGVCVLSEDRPAGWMQDVAREMNLSETAFLLRQDGQWSLRWFTPTVEVDLCGHATLASAHILWTERFAEEGSVLRFSTRSGDLSASRGGDEKIELDFPAEPASRCEVSADVLAALGVAGVREAGRNRFDLIVELDDEAAVRALAPDFGRLEAAAGPRGVIATARSARPEFDFVSRFFAPAVGIDEDPVTGSAHCCLAPYWAERLGRTELTGYQASARGGIVGVRVAGNRVVLAGDAVTVSRGELAATS